MTTVKILKRGMLFNIAFLLQTYQTVFMFLYFQKDFREIREENEQDKKRLQKLPSRDSDII